MFMMTNIGLRVHVTLPVLHHALCVGPEEPDSDGQFLRAIPVPRPSPPMGHAPDGHNVWLQPQVRPVRDGRRTHLLLHRGRDSQVA